ncbi:hypothetical protein BD309DRAFT_53768 [Dichomitus squalens]|nr:hypothetical protein BD309DRAFT_53768 [Dichomitus squalens]
MAATRTASPAERDLTVHERSLADNCFDEGQYEAAIAALDEIRSRKSKPYEEHWKRERRQKSGLVRLVHFMQADEDLLAHGSRATSLVLVMPILPLARQLSHQHMRESLTIECCVRAQIPASTAEHRTLTRAPNGMRCTHPWTAMRLQITAASHKL